MHASCYPRCMHIFPQTYFAPATSKIGALRLVSRNEPDVAVASATSTHLSTS